MEDVGGLVGSEPSPRVAFISSCVILQWVEIFFFVSRF